MDDGHGRAPMIPVIVPAGRGGRPLVRTADSITRQSVPGAIVLALVGDGAAPPLVPSVVTRLHAAVHRGRNTAAAINAAAVHTSGLADADGRGRASGWFAVVPAGLTLSRTFMARCASAFDDDLEAAAVVPSVRLHSADALSAETWRVSSTALAGVLADPRTTPPVVALRRSAWTRLGGLDEDLPGLADYDLWIRLCALNLPVVLLEDALVSRDLSQPAIWPAPAPDADHLRAIRAVYQKHQRLLERAMEAVLVEREVAFVRLREAHGDLVRRRDADLAELDRRRAEAAHHRAYVRHHGREAVDWGDLRRTDPLSRDWGYDRGTPVDRRYIEQFLAAHSSDVRGAVLEVQEDDFTRRFGGRRVATSDVLDLETGNARATIHADLRCAPEIASEAYDCIILTQTLHVIDDAAAALSECVRLLKPGGVVLATLPSASRVCLEYGEEGDLWRVTRAGAVSMFEKAFGAGAVESTAYGNVLTNVAFLHGVAGEELADAEFEAHDPYYPALVGVRARKGGAGRPRGVVLLYHRVHDARDAYGMNVPVRAFEAQMSWLKKECHVLPLDELLGTAPEHLPARAVALTFDDGYTDSLTVAAPILQARGLPAAFFVTTRWIEQAGEYWWDLIERALLSDGPVPAELALQGEASLERLATRTPEDRRRAHQRLHDLMVHAPLHLRDDIVRAIEAWALPGPRRYQPMTADQIRALARLPGVTIGAHTVNHLALRDQPDEASLEELRKCRADLERLLDRTIDLVAYPYGAVGGGSVAHVRMEWKWGLACDQRPVGDSFDAARVPRIDVGGVADISHNADQLGGLVALGRMLDSF
jgi:peptidoglycan/xylan/chitin deacetylase (PgdA/CDA1 family)